MQELLDQNQQNEYAYFLYVFGGLASHNLNEDIKALEYFKSAIDIDPENPNALQGILKVYVSNDSLIDGFALNAVNKLLNNEKFVFFYYSKNF